MNFISYEKSYLEDCLNLFDRNCPQFFAENERADYLAFLEQTPANYQIGVDGGTTVAAFGITIDAQADRGRINWIMVCPDSKGRGIGRSMMRHAARVAQQHGLSVLDIAASQLSAPFFEKFGAKVIRISRDGWGPDMHRVDMEWKIEREAA